MTVNEWLASEAVRHAIALRFYSTGVVHRLVAVLNRADARLFADLTQALERMGPESFTVERLDALLLGVRSINAAAYRALESGMLDELKEFAAYESAYQAQALRVAVPPAVAVSGVSVDAVFAAAYARPFQGVLLREVWKDMGNKRMQLVRRTIAQGFVEGRPVAEIVRELRGTRAKGYTDGLVNRSRHEVEAIVRTAIGHYSGYVSSKIEEANIDLIKAVKWLSTLDGRTSEICRIRDGKLYDPVTHKPQGHKLPWLGGPGAAHFGCRSKATFVTKSWRELGSKVDVKDFSPTERASMNGQVSADLTYYEWLKGQPAGVQDEVLGPQRGKLLRDGKLSIDRFHDDKGRWLTLDQLRKADEAAFKRAGLG